MLITPLFQGWIKSVAALGCAVFLAACGGGGKTSAPASEANVSSLSSLSSATVSSSSSSLGNHLMGGTIQGSPLNISGVVTTLAGMPVSADGIGLATTFNSPEGAVIDEANLYIADSRNHKIRKIVIATGEVTTLAGSGSQGGADGTGAAARFYYPMGIARVGNSLYVTDGNRIRKIVIATGLVSTLAGIGFAGNADGIGTLANFSNPRGITTDGTNLYIADMGNNKIRKVVIATGEVTTLAVGGSPDDAASGASFYLPEDITSDGVNLYVMGGYGIRKIVMATGEVTALATSCPECTELPFDELHVNASQSITSDGNNLYVANGVTNQIRKIVIATGVTTILAGSSAKGGADSAGTTASFVNPGGISSDGTNLYVADISSNQIRKIVIATGAVTMLAGGSSRGNANGAGAAAKFYSPNGITSDGTNLYIADTGNNKIRKVVIATDEVTTLAGSDSLINGDGTGTAAGFNWPAGITNDGANLYVADTFNNQIRKIVIATGVVTTLVGDPYVSATSLSATSSLLYPSDITTDGTNLYAIELSGQAIKKIVIATGEVSTLAGSGSVGKTDGIGAAASFFSAAGITSDGTSLYVTDSGNFNIRKIVIATGAVTTLAGSGSEGSADGTGTAASFTYPAGITSDGTNLYVTDSGSHKVRKIVIATGVVTTLVGSGLQGSADGVGAAASFNSPYGITSNGFELFVTDTGNNTIRKIH